MWGIKWSYRCKGWLSNEIRTNPPLHSHHTHNSPFHLKSTEISLLHSQSFLQTPFIGFLVFPASSTADGGGCVTVFPAAFPAKKGLDSADKRRFEPWWASSSISISDSSYLGWFERSVLWLKITHQIEIKILFVVFEKRFDDYLNVA